jgi:hypothetical protein
MILSNIARINKMIGNRKIAFLVTVLVLLSGLIGANTLMVKAQIRYQWAFQRQIPDYYNHSRAPYMVADQNRTVHAFNIQPTVQDEVALYYRQWSKERGWTRPVDILLPPRVGTFSVQEVFLDPSAILHMVFFVGDPDSANLYFTSAHASMAGHARSWSQPVVITDDAGPLGSAAMVHDDNGVIVVVYAGRKNGIGVYEVRSLDNGNTWSAPQVVSLVLEDELWPYALQMIKDDTGNLHAVWSLISVRGLGQAIYYSRSNFTENQWSQPYLLAELEGDDYSTNFPSIIKHKDELFVIYQDDFPATRWMRRSKDNGQVWTSPVRPFLHEGEYEAAVLLEDSNQTLHMILGNRIGNPEIHGMWHSFWTGERWTDLEPVVSGPKTNLFDPSAPQAVISQGNVLLASWWMDTSSIYRNGAWYSYTELDAPELPVRPVPTLPPSPTPSLAVVAIPTFSPTTTPTPQVPISNIDNDENTFLSNPSIPIIIGILPVLVFVSVLITIRNQVMKRLSSNQKSD